jgi:hypothetical protein
MKHKEIFYHYDKIVNKLKENKDVIVKELENNKNFRTLSEIGREMLFNSFIYFGEVNNDTQLEYLVLSSDIIENNNGINSSLDYFFDSDKGRFKISLIETYTPIEINKYQKKTKNELKFSIIKLGNTDKDSFQNKDVTVAEHIIYSNMFDVKEYNVNDFPYDTLRYLNPNTIYNSLFSKIKYKNDFDYGDDVLHAQYEDYFNLIND